eukprot:gene7054-11217_t
MSQIPGFPPPKNGIFYTISELKEHGTDVSNHIGEKKSKKSKKTSSSVPLSPTEIIEESPKIKKTTKKTTTKKSTTTKKTATKSDVSEKDKVYWITKGRRKVLVHNGVQKSGAAAYSTYQKYKDLSPSPKIKKTTKKTTRKQSDDEDKVTKKQKTTKKRSPSKSKSSSEEILKENQVKLDEYLKLNPPTPKPTVHKFNEVIELD